MRGVVRCVKRGVCMRNITRDVQRGGRHDKVPNKNKKTKKSPNKTTQKNKKKLPMNFKKSQKILSLSLSLSLVLSLSLSLSLKTTTTTTTTKTHHFVDSTASTVRHPPSRGALGERLGIDGDATPTPTWG